MVKHVAKSTFRGSSLIGLYGFVTESFAVLPRQFKHRDVLGVDNIVRGSIDRSNLLGIFLAGNTNGIVAPDVAYPDEQDVLKQAAPVTIVESVHTAFGNLILCNDHGAYISPLLQEEEHAIAAALDVPVTVGKIVGLDVVGSCGVATNNGVLLHRDAAEDEIAAVEDALNVSADIGSVNFGSPYVKSGLLATTHGFLVGENTTGIEVQRIDEALGFLD